MILQLRLPDEVWEAYLEHSKTNPQRAMEEQLKRFKDVKPEDRTLLLTRAQRTRLEAAWGRPVEDLDKMVSDVEALISIEADKVKIPLTEGQRKRLSTEAKFYKKEFPVYAKTRISDAIRGAIGD